MSDDGDPDLLERLAELFLEIKSGNVTGLAWVTIDQDGEARVAASGDPEQVLEGIEELEREVRNASKARKTRGVA